jgi:hypothetical protein
MVVARDQPISHFFLLTSRNRSGLSHPDASMEIAADAVILPHADVDLAMHSRRDLREERCRYRLN